MLQMATILCYASYFLFATTLIPLIKHDFWIFRVFEYPRLQKLVINLALIVLILCFAFPKERYSYLVLAMLVVNLIYLCYLIFPYTRLAQKQIVTTKNPSGANNLKILIANVYQENRNWAAYFKIIKDCGPDIVLMVETNGWWQEQMDGLSNTYPYQHKVPLENTYGMLLYSKLPLEGKVDFLVEADIPSIETVVSLASGKKVRLFCLHPKPPVPQENPRSTERDKEILLVAKKANASELPVVVMGDLNDVAWSYTTGLFGKISGLLDPRRGRGFFNSFNAKYFFLRFPLDHIFCSSDFALRSIKRLASCGSDHFPVYVNLELAPQLEQFNESLEATPEEKQLAAQKIEAC